MNITIQCVNMTFVLIEKRVGATTKAAGTSLNILHKIE
jgi:hypothetical protein